MTHDPAWIAWFSQIDGVGALGIAVGAALPLVPAIQQYIRHGVAYRRLGPLWRSLTDAIPQVRLAQAATRRSVAMVGLRLGLYRRVVEIRDAMLVLRSYVSVDEMQAAREHVQRRAVPEELVDVTVTAQWLKAALDNRQQGLTASAQHENIAGVGGDAFDQEVKFLLQVADAYSGGVTVATR